MVRLEDNVPDVTWGDTIGGIRDPGYRCVFNAIDVQDRYASWLVL